MKNFFLILIISMVSFSLANSQPAKMHHGFFNNGSRLEKLLKLTDEQTKKFNDLKYDSEQKSIDLRSQIQKNRLDLRKLMSEKKLDSKRILELTNKNSEIQAKLKEIHVKTLIDMNNLLTNEQKEIFAEHMARMKEKFQDGCWERPINSRPRKGIY